MVNYEFFKAAQEPEATAGESKAYWAWRNGIHEKLDFPLQKDSMWDKDVSDFLTTIEKAGFKKFGFYARSTNALQNIVDFMKAGWKATGTFEFDRDLEELGYKPCEGLIFEKE